MHQVGKKRLSLQVSMSTGHSTAQQTF